MLADSVVLTTGASLAGVGFGLLVLAPPALEPSFFGVCADLTFSGCADLTGSGCAYLAGSGCAGVEAVVCCVRGWGDGLEGANVLSSSP